MKLSPTVCWAVNFYCLLLILFAVTTLMAGKPLYLSLYMYDPFYDKEFIIMINIVLCTRFPYRLRRKVTSVRLGVAAGLRARVAFCLNFRSQADLAICPFLPRLTFNLVDCIRFISREYRILIIILGT